jgi:hypothetical protein
MATTRLKAAITAQSGRSTGVLNEGKEVLVSTESAVGRNHSLPMPKKQKPLITSYAGARSATLNAVKSSVKY